MSDGSRAGARSEYPKSALGRNDREGLLADFLPFAEVFPGPVPGLRNVECGDPHYQVSFELAMACGADVVVTSDAGLLALAGRAGVPILTPAELRGRVEGKA